MAKVEYIPEEDAAKLIGLTAKYFREQIKKGKWLISFRTRPSGRGYQYNKIEIEKLLNEHSSQVK